MRDGQWSGRKPKAVQKANDTFRKGEDANMVCGAWGKAPDSHQTTQDKPGNIQLARSSSPRILTHLRLTLIYVFS